MVQTAEGALTEVHAMLNRIRELAVEAANSTLSSTDAASVSTEITALRDEINRIAGATTFNGQYLLTGALSVTQGATSTAKVGVSLATATSTIGGVDVSGAKASTTYTITSQAGGKVTLSDGTGLSQQVTMSDLPVAGGSQTISFGNLGVKITVVGAGGGATAVNLATDLAGKTVITGAGTGANFQIGANAPDSLGVSFADSRLTAVGYGSLDTDITAFETATGSGTGIVGAAQALITACDTAIGYVSTTRGNLGAVQNRLEHTTASISVASENLNASQSRIRDLDVASEMVNFTKTQILQQAGTAILAQANSAPQNILTLLRG
jgi:flagellin